MASAILEIEGLTFRYRRATEPALREISLRVEPGEVILVAGPSGCGKSTLIRAINGLIPHSYRGDLAGTVTVDGRSTAEMRLRDLATLVGTVLQDPRKQLVASTVAAELAFGPENLGVPRAEIARQMAEVASAGGIDDLIPRTTDQLSGGESQQVAIGGALMMRPRVVVLDEPLANLDPVAAHRLLGLVRRLADAGTAVVIVEHRVEDVLAARPDRVLYLDAGTVRYLGGLDGFLAVADPELVKLPFDVALARAHAGAPAGTPAEFASGAHLAAGVADVPSPAVDASAPPRLEWRAVEAGYDNRVVLHAVSGRLGAHERVAVLGPNGSGKTTLFKTAIGLLRPSSGEVLVDGRSTGESSVAELARTFGYVFQNPSQMLFAPTVREELLFGPRNMGRPAEGFERLVNETLGRVNLDGEAQIADRPPLTLSFGQQKRLALAVALALQPRTLVLDEPSAGQDHRSATAFMTEVGRIAGLESVYFVTHDADLALTHAHRIVLLRDGRIAADGPPLEVIADRERWSSCNLRVTSLIEANLRWGRRTGRFLGARDLAAWIVEAAGTEGGGIGPAQREGRA